jgi:hypothetical protein
MDAVIAIETSAPLPLVVIPRRFSQSLALFDTFFRQASVPMQWRFVAVWRYVVSTFRMSNEVQNF